MTARTHRRSAVGRVFEHRLLQYRRTFRSSIFSSFLTPVLFLAFGRKAVERIQAGRAGALTPAEAF